MNEEYDKAFKVPITINYTPFYFVFLVKIAKKTPPDFRFCVFFSNRDGEIVQNLFISTWPGSEFLLYKDSDIIATTKTIRKYYDLLMDHIRLVLRTGIELPAEERFGVDIHDFITIPDFDSIPIFISVEVAVKHMFPEIAKQSSFFEVSAFNLPEGPENITVLQRKLVQRLHHAFVPLSYEEENQLANFLLPLNRLDNVLWTTAYRRKMLKIVLASYEKKTGNLFVPVVAMENGSNINMDKKVLSYVSKISYVYDIHVMGKHVYPVYEEMHGEEKFQRIMKDMMKERYNKIIQAKGKLIGIHTYDIFFPGFVKIVPAERVEAIDNKSVKIRDCYNTFDTVKESKSRKIITLPIDRIVFYDDIVKDQNLGR